MKPEKWPNLKVWAATRRKLKTIAALTDKNLVEVVDALANEELKRMGLRGVAKE